MTMVSGCYKAMNAVGRGVAAVFNGAVGPGIAAVFNVASGEVWLARRGLDRREPSFVWPMFVCGLSVGMAPGYLLELAGAIVPVAVLCGFVPVHLDALYRAGKYDAKEAAVPPAPRDDSRSQSPGPG